MGSIVESMKHLFSNQKSSVDYYNQMNTDIVGLGGVNSKKWMNVGYWESAENYNIACEALAMKLAQFGDFKSGTNLLDVGCGCGEQDFFWKKQFPQLDIHAMDITPLHIEIASKRNAKEQVVGSFQVGNACALPFETGSFSRVCALDCAYHFDPREEFLKEAYRVLLPGGKFVASEMLPVQGEVTNKKKQIKGRQGLFLPDVNMYPIEEYVKKLEKIGFVNVRWEAVGHIVYKGLSLYFLNRYLHPRKPIDEVKIKFNRKKWSDLYTGLFDYLYGTEEYYFVSAKKPVEIDRNGGRQ
ncbi:MAG: methyltransferase domain-containing protein [Lachnospiraceae bacterium]|nr:methyltransferase domain-containing protein [Lachnospiraceae bacterium]